MEKLIENLRVAADSLKIVIAGFKIPLDTSTFDKALNDLLAEVGKSDKSSDK